MFTLIFSAAFATIAALAILIGILKGRKKVWQFSLSKIIMTVFAALLSTIASIIICWVVIRVVGDSLISSGTLSEFGEMMTELPSLKTALFAFVSMLLAPLLFLIFFLIFRPIAGIFSKMVARAIMSKKKKKALYDAKMQENPEVSIAIKKKQYKKEVLTLKKSHWLSVLLGGFSGLMLLCVLLVPIVGACGVVDDIASSALDALDNGDNKTITTAKEAISAAGTNAGTATVRLMGGGLLYDLMTSYPSDEGMITLRKESNFIESAISGYSVISNEGMPITEKKDRIEKISASFNKSTLMPIVLSDLASAVSSDWKQGEDFYGMKMPMADSEFGVVIHSFVDGFAESNPTTIKEDVKTVTDIICLLVENDVLSSIEEDPMKLLSNENCTSEILYSLLENDRFEGSVKAISRFGINTMMTALNAPENLDGLYNEMIDELKSVNVYEAQSPANEYSNIFESYGLIVTEDTCNKLLKNVYLSGKETIATWISENVCTESAFEETTLLVTTGDIIDIEKEIIDTEHEAKSLAHAYAVLATLVEDIDGGDSKIKALIQDLGPALDSFAETEIIGYNGAEKILIALLQSELSRDNLGFTMEIATDTAKSVSKNAKTKKFDGMLNFLSNLADLVDSAGNKEVDTNNIVNSLLDDLSTESAEVIQSMAKPSVMINNGVPERSAVPTSDLISNAFGNLAAARDNGMSDEDYNKEAAAVSNMMDVMMAASKTGTNDQPLFGGEESSTSIDADSYVNNLMDSTVMSEAIVNQVYADGETPDKDPLNLERVGDENERENILNSINTRWETEKANNNTGIETQKKLISIAALTNTHIELDTANNSWVLIYQET